jgi:O-antigen/teichoic acid export membrane protein
LRALVNRIRIRLHLTEPGHPASDRYRRIFRVISHFIVGQTALQGLQLVSGLLLIRYLSLAEYAVYAYVLTAQATGAVLNDLGARNALIALCGASHQDKKTVANLIATALFLRAFLTVLGAGVMLALLATFHFTHETSLFSLFLYFILCTVAIYLNSWTSYFTIPFLLEHRMSELYGPQVLAGAIRIGIIVGLASIGWLWLCFPPRCGPLFKIKLWYFYFRYSDASRI